MTDPAEQTLPGKVDLLTTAVDRATTAVERETAARHRSMRLTVAAMTLGFLVFAALIWVVRQDANHRESDRTAAAVVSCRNANASRTALEQRIENFGGLFIQALSEVSPVTTDDAAKQRQQVVEAITANVTKKMQDSVPPELQQRDCSPKAAVNPAPVQR